MKSVNDSFAFLASFKGEKPLDELARGRSLCLPQARVKALFAI